MYMFPVLHLKFMYTFMWFYRQMDDSQFVIWTSRKKIFLCWFLVKMNNFVLYLCKRFFFNLCRFARNLSQFCINRNNEQLVYNSWYLVVLLYNIWQRDYSKFNTVVGSINSGWLSFVSPQNTVKILFVPFQCVL